MMNRLPLLALLTCTLPCTAAPEWDIVGLRLGMNEAEAKAALAAHSAQAQVSERSLRFTFHDGAKQQESPGFLSTIEARIPGPAGEVIQLELSAPPLPQRVIRVRRTLSAYDDPPPLERMLGSVTQKYGKPAAQRKHGIGNITTVASWTEQGKPVCGLKAGPNQPLVLPSVSQSPDALRWYRRQQQQNLAPADASRCSAVLQVDLITRAGGSSVVTLSFEMNDPGHAVPAMEATSRWLADLEAAARKARLGSGATPKL